MLTSCFPGSHLASSPWSRVADLVTEGGEDVGLMHVAPCIGFGDDTDTVSRGAGGNWAGGPGGCSKSVRLNRETASYFVHRGDLCGQSRPLRVGHHHLGCDVEAKRRCLLQHEDGIPAAYDRLGIG